MRLHPALALLLAAALLPAALPAQPRPLSGVFRISHPFTGTDGLEQFDFEPAVAALASGDFAVAWAFQNSFGCCAFQDDGIDGRLVSFAGQPGADFEVIHNLGASPSFGCPALAATPTGFLLAYTAFGEIGSVIRLIRHEPLGFSGSRAGKAAESDEKLCPALATNASGQFVLAWGQTPPGASPTTYFVLPYQADQPFTLDTPGPSLDELPPAVGIDSAGRSVVVWRGSSTPGLFARRFAADGTPLGAPFPIVTDYADGPFLAMAPDGGFTVIYTKPAPAGQPHALVLRRFGSDDRAVGTPVSPGAILPVSPGTIAALPKVSADHYGNFALSWQDRDGRPRIQVFDRSLAARGAAVDALPAVPSPVHHDPPAIALADSGRLLAVWADGSIADNQPFAVRGRLWQALREASFCVYRGGRFLCDAAANGQPSAVFAFGSGPPADQPLLGDVDGDGLTDPCVHHGNRFACDTARNGGAAEVRIDFGLPSDVPFLADVDGDGRADPCVHRGNRFLCDTKHNGVFAEVKIAFGVPGDLALLGDVDGDRRADPCIYRGGVVYCDTAHDGVFAETRLDLRPALGGAPDGVPLLGDVDGDGRADACFYQSGTLTCAIFAKAGGAPLQVTRRQTFGQPGDVPLLAYVGPR